MNVLKSFFVILSLSFTAQAQDGFEEIPPSQAENLPEVPENIQPAPQPVVPAEEELVPPDPFADQPSAPAETVVPPTANPAPVEAAPARPQFQDPFTQNPGGSPMEVPPSQATTPAPPIQNPPSFEPPRAKPFEFPDPSKSKGQGPITQDIVRSEQVRQVTPEGTWSLGFSGGGAFNVNRRLNQSAFELYMDYRISADFEIGQLTYFRSGGDNLLGLLMTAKYFFRITDPDSFRIELAPVLGVGWTFRGEDTSLNEGRFPLRYGLDTLMYAYPNFAVVVHAHMESFLFGQDPQKKWVSYFKGGGPLTQVIVNLGLRFQF